MFLKTIQKKGNKRIYQLAKEQGKNSQEILALAHQCGIEVTTASSSLTEVEEAAIVLALHPRKKKEKAKVSQSVKKQAVKKYEKKQVKAAKIPKVREVSKQTANRWFVFLLVVISSFLLAMGGLGIISSLRMNRLVRDSNQAIQVLNQENEKQNEAIRQLQQAGGKP